MSDLPLSDNVFSPHKLFVHMDRMHDWWQGKNIYPIAMELSPTTVCNHFCSWCMHGGYFGKHPKDEKNLKLYPDASFMEFDFYAGLLDELVTLGTKSMVFSGSGEPYVNTNFSALSGLHKGEGSRYRCHYERVPFRRRIGAGNSSERQLGSNKFECRVCRDPRTGSQGRRVRF